VLLQLSDWDIGSDNDLDDSEDGSNSEGEKCDKDSHFGDDDLTPLLTSTAEKREGVSSRQQEC